MPDLQRDFGWPAAAVVDTPTSAVQFGFAVGAFLFALLAIAKDLPTPHNAMA